MEGLKALIAFARDLDIVGVLVVVLISFQRRWVRWGKDVDDDLEAERKVTALETARADKAEDALRAANEQFLKTNNEFLMALREQAMRLQVREEGRT
jgi:hypothetical protein